MPSKFVRYDKSISARLELDQPGIQRAARHLLDAITNAVATGSVQEAHLQPLIEYAQAGLRGEITYPHNWQVDPMRYELRERLLPSEVSDAYAAYTFFTHGMLRDIPKFTEINGQTYVEVVD